MGLKPSTLASAGCRSPKFRGRRLWARITSRYRSLSSMAASGEQRACAFDAGAEPVDFIEGVVERERSAGRGGQLEEIHDRHGAMMAGTNCNPVFVEDGAQIMRMHAGNRK